jgi:hypothetical protein
MMLSKTAEEEIRSQAHSAGFKDEMASLARSRHNPFMKGGRADVDAYITFVSEFNEFISHKPKRFVAIIDRNMRL